MHFESRVTEPGESGGLSEELFDWDVGEEQMDGYRLVGTTDGSIGGGLLRTPEGVFLYVTIYVGVDNLVGTLERAEELGGKTIVEPMPILEQADSRCSGCGRRDARIVRGEA